LRRSLAQQPELLLFSAWFAALAHVGTGCADVLGMMRAKHVTGFAGMVLLMLGCQSQIIGGGNGGSGGGVDTTTSSAFTGSGGGTDMDGGAAPSPNDGPAIAMLRSELPPPDVDVETGGVTSGGGPALDPNTLMIFLGDTTQRCNDPFVGSCTQQFQVGIQLPTSLQAVGTYPLQDHAYFSVSLGGDPGECSGGGGTYWDGTIDVTAIDATQVTFTLAGTGNLFGYPGNADGTYTAKRCF
jgi:hypothetical protein